MLEEEREGAATVPPSLTEITADELAQNIDGRSRQEKLLVVDCRSFFEFNQSHIINSVNACGSKLVQRRLQQNKVKITSYLQQYCYTDISPDLTIILYDQRSPGFHRLPLSSYIRLVAAKCSEVFSRVRFLSGGFHDFQTSHPALCESKVLPDTSNLGPIGSDGGTSGTARSLASSQPCVSVTSSDGPTKIFPYLFLGSMTDAMSADHAKVNGITYVLNVSNLEAKVPHIPEGHLMRIPVNDTLSDKLLPFFAKAIQFIDMVREANGVVLVHCLAGVSRSATLTIAYIMKTFRLKSEDAYRYVKEKRPAISPNFNFLGQLLEFETEVVRDVAYPTTVSLDLACRDVSLVRSGLPISGLDTGSSVSSEPPAQAVTARPLSVSSLVCAEENQPATGPRCEHSRGANYSSTNTGGSLSIKRRKNAQDLSTDFVTPPKATCLLSPSQHGITVPVAEEERGETCSSPKPSPPPTPPPSLTRRRKVLPPPTTAPTLPSPTSALAQLRFESSVGGSTSPNCVTPPTHGIYGDINKTTAPVAADRNHMPANNSSDFRSSWMDSNNVEGSNTTGHLIPTIKVSVSATEGFLTSEKNSIGRQSTMATSLDNSTTFVPTPAPRAFTTTGSLDSSHRRRRSHAAMAIGSSSPGSSSGMSLNLVPCTSQEYCPYKSQTMPAGGLSGSRSDNSGSRSEVRLRGATNSRRPNSIPLVGSGSEPLAPFSLPPMGFMLSSASLSPAAAACKKDTGIYVAVTIPKITELGALTSLTKSSEASVPGGDPVPMDQSPPPVPQAPPITVPILSSPCPLVPPRLGIGSIASTKKQSEEFISPSSVASHHREPSSKERSRSVEDTLRAAGRAGLCPSQGGSGVGPVRQRASTVSDGTTSRGGERAIYSIGSGGMGVSLGSLGGPLSQSTGSVSSNGSVEIQVS